MKLIFKLAFALILCTSSVVTFGQGTEEYAIISVHQQGKTKYISVTIGSTATEEKEVTSDMAPVIAEMEKLNQTGFELVNGSVAGMAHGTMASDPFYTFIFKRRK